MAGNKLDKVFATLANNRSLYQALIDGVEEETIAAMDKFHTSAASALYHSNEVPQACGQGGVYHAWDDLLNRLRRIQKY